MPNDNRLFNMIVQSRKTDLYQYGWKIITIKYKTIIHFYPTNIETFIDEWAKQIIYTKGNAVNEVNMKNVYHDS